MTPRLTALFVLLLALPALAVEPTCKRNPALTGACRMVKGSLGLTPGLGVTLVDEDGARTLIKAPPGSNADIAPQVMQNWLYWQSRTGSIRARISGSYELCPLPTEINAAGIRDFGCINSGTRITVDKAESPAQ